MALDLEMNKVAFDLDGVFIPDCDRMPKMVWHENSIDDEPWVYKAEVINQNGINFFIESDLKTVEYLRKHTKANIVHFDDLINELYLNP